MEKYSDGYLTVFCGPAYSGKTETLIKTLYRYKYAKKKILFIFPKNHINDKDKLAKIERDYIKVIYVSKTSEILLCLKDYHDFNAIGIDNIQEIVDDIDIAKVIDMILRLKIDVFITGRDTDTDGNVVRITSDLLAKAQVVKKMNSMCSICGKLASRTVSIENKDSTKTSSTTYEPRCLDCFRKQKRGII